MIHNNWKDFLLFKKAPSKQSRSQDVRGQWWGNEKFLYNAINYKLFLYNNFKKNFKFVNVLDKFLERVINLSKNPLNLKFLQRIEKIFLQKQYRVFECFSKL